MVTEINWARIGRAISYYKSIGYEYMEVPWAVSGKSIKETCPKEIPLLETYFGSLVGSGEQSFIELLRGNKKITKAVCCTPCFRIEKEYNDISCPYFMKVELINTQRTAAGGFDLETVVSDAEKFFKSEGIHTVIKEVKEFQLDLEDCKGLELGSYGLRELGDIEFIYGTGLAEPRTSISLERNKV